MHSGPDRRFVLSLGSSLVPSLVCALLLGVAYWTALPAHVQSGDAGEFSTVLLTGGMPHPSGYPWMRMLGVCARMGHVVGLAPATAAALPCAVAGVLGWVVLQRTVASWGAPWLGCWIACLAGLGSTSLLHIPDAEVWGPHILWCALFAHLALSPRRPPAFVLGLVLGLAASHHLTAVLLTPLAMGHAWPDPARPRKVIRAGVDGLAGVAVGLGAYLSLLVGDGGGWRWGDVAGFSGLWRHVTRADYGTLSLSLQEATPAPTLLMERSVTNVAADLTVGLGASIWIAIPFLAVLVAAAVRARPEAVRAPAWWGLLSSLVLSIFVFPASHNLDPRSPFSSWILERFDLLTLLLVALLLAAGLRPALDRIPRRHTWMVTLIGAAILVLQYQRSLSRGTPALDDGVERYALDLLDTPTARHALVIGTDDHRLFPVVYAQAVLEASPDTVYLDASLLSQAWYRQRARGQWAQIPEIDKPVRLISSFWSDPARRDLPIYVANVFSRPAREQLTLVPEGVLWRVVPPHAPPEEFGLDAVLERHRAAFARLRGVAPSPYVGHPWAGDLAASYVDTTRTLADWLVAAGRGEEAAALLAELEEKMSAAAR